jgi:hypothetical protein
LALDLVSEVQATVVAVSNKVTKLVHADHGEHVRPLIAADSLLNAAFHEIDAAHMELTEPFFES